MVCVLALPYRPHALIEGVKRDECILLMVNEWESTGQHCDIAYCLERDWGM